MSILLVAEHNDAALNPVTLNVLAAAQAIGGDITVLVAGEGCGAAAEAAAALPGVSKVLSADAAIYGKQLAENVAPSLPRPLRGTATCCRPTAPTARTPCRGWPRSSM